MYFRIMTSKETFQVSVFLQDLRKDGGCYFGLTFITQADIDKHGKSITLTKASNRPIQELDSIVNLLKYYGEIKFIDEPVEEKKTPQFDEATELRIQEEVNRRVSKIVKDREDEERWKYSIEHGFK